MAAKVAPAGDLPESSYSNVALLKDEDSTMMLECEGITTITFLKGDADKAIEALRSKFLQVARVNLWLTGRLKRDKKVEGGRLCIRHAHVEDDLASRLEPLYVVDRMLTINSRLPYDRLSKVIKKSGAIICKGRGLINKDAPFVRLTIAPQSSDEFAMIFSLSHVVADGFTYYKLLNMLGSNGVVGELVAKRKVAEQAKIMDVVGKAQHLYQFSMGFVCPILCGGMCCSPKTELLAYYVDLEKIEDIRKNAVKGTTIEFVSTNDVLTSGFGTATGLTLMSMAINMRGRVEGLEAADAGNYESGLLFERSSYAEPTLIREVYRRDPPMSRAQHLPGVCHACFCCGCCRTKIGQVTDWASLHSDDFGVDECEVLLHVPFMEDVGCDIAIPFKAQPGKLAVLYFAKYATKDILKSKCGLTAPVCMEMFPAS